MESSGKKIANLLRLQQWYNFRKFKMFSTNLLWQGGTDLCRKSKKGACFEVVNFAFRICVLPSTVLVLMLFFSMGSTLIYFLPPLPPFPFKVPLFDKKHHVFSPSSLFLEQKSLFLDKCIGLLFCNVCCLIARMLYVS